MTVLRLPYYSQWDIDANRRRTDCGPTCVKMVIAGVKGYIIPVNHLVNDTAEAFSDNGLPTEALQQLLAAFAVQSRIENHGRDRASMKAAILAALARGNPVIALITYGYIPERMDRNDVNGGHFVVISAATDDRVYLHDPDFWGDHPASDGMFLPVQWSELLGGIANSPVPGQVLIVNEDMRMVNSFAALAPYILALKDNPNARIAITVSIDGPDAGVIMPPEYGGTVGDFLAQFQVIPYTPPPTNALITTSGLNLRDAPNGKIIGSVANEATVITTGAKKDEGGLTWVEITQASGVAVHGWIAAKYTKVP